MKTLDHYHSDDDDGGSSGGGIFQLRIIHCYE